VSGDLTGRQPLCRERQYDLIDTSQPALTLLDDLWLERAVRIARYLDLDRPDLGEHRLGPDAVTGVAAAPPHRIVLVIAQVLGHLRIQRGLEHVLGQLVEQPIRANQFDSLFLRLRQQLLGKLPVIQFGSHGIECF